MNSSSSISSAAREVELSFDFCGVKNVKIDIADPSFCVVIKTPFDLTAIGKTGSARNDEGEDVGKVPSFSYPPVPESLPLGFEEVRERQ